MKLLPIILSTAFLATPVFAAPGGEGGNTGCNGVGNINSPCQGGGGNGGSDNPGNGNNPGNGGNGGQGGNGGNGGSGGQGGQGGSGGHADVSSTNVNANANANVNGNNNSNSNRVEGTLDSRSQSNSNSNSQSNSSSSSAGGNSSATSGNSSSKLVNRNTNYDERETPVAPLLGNSDTASLEGVVVPLPTVGISGFYTQGDSYGYRDDIGITLAFRTPLGGGAFRDAALRREKFRIIQEAVFLRSQGLLNYEDHPQHYIALYGKAPAPTDSTAK